MNKSYMMTKYLFVLSFLLLFFSDVSSQVIPLPAPVGVFDANDPSMAANNPTGVACGGGGVETWIDFDGMAGNNASTEGGMAIGAYHQQVHTYTFPATFAPAAGDEFTIYFEYANPGLDECGTIRNGTGRWQFDLNGGGFVNGHTAIPVGTTGTMEWFKSSVTLTADGTNPVVLSIKPRRSGAGANPYMQIDNMIMVSAPASVCDAVDLGTPALNACYGIIDACYPTSNACAEITPGDPHINPAACPVTAGDPDALVIIPIPDFDANTDCATAEAVTFDMVVPDLEVHYTYWGNCSPLSPEMPTVLDAQNQGFITQFFCDTDPVTGLPAFSGGLSGESGIIDFIPANTEDTGCNGFVDEAATDCICGGGSASTDPEDAGVELLQLDFWVAIPTYQTQVGFNFDNFTGNPVEGASMFVGPNTANMCEVSFYNYGGAMGDHNDEPQQPSGTYTLDHGSLLQDDCNASWLRVRIYMSDVKDRWGIIPQMDCGNGYAPMSALPVAAAMNADDNTQPAALTTMPVDGYSLTVGGQEFLYDDQGNSKKYACNPITRTGDAGICAVPCDPAAVMAAIAPPVDITSESTCEANGTTLSGGVIAAPATACPASSTLEYSTDAGTNWTTTLPVYDQENSITVTTRCVCDNDPAIVSMTSEEATTPGTCAACDPAIAAATAPPVIITSESVCAPGDTEPSGGVISPPTTDTCPAGSTLNYSIDGGTTWTDELSPTLYDQSNAITVTTGCLCDLDMAVVSMTSDVPTTPGTCCDPAIAAATAPPVIITSESVCAPGDTEPSGGVISPPTTDTCPAGSTLNYSIDGGTTWTDVLSPTLYDQSNAITVTTGCLCDLDMTVVSMTSDVPTTPGTCVADDCDADNGVLSIGTP